MDLTQLRIRRLELDDARLFFTLFNGVRLDEPIKGYLQLEKATPAQRLQWQPTADAFGVNWPQLEPSTPDGLVNVLDLLWERRCRAALKRLRSAGDTFAALSVQDQALVALWRLDTDLNNEGFLQFLSDWGDATCQAALTALQAIGAERTHAIVAQLRTLLDRFERDPAIRSVEDIARAMREDERRQLAALEEAYYDRPDALVGLALAHFGLDRGSTPPAAPPPTALPGA
jgi:sulfur relay (sulfurtransferase) DsrC/TusE family protein